MRPTYPRRGAASHRVLLHVIRHALDTAVWAVMDDFPALQGDPHPWRPEPHDQREARRLLRRVRCFSRVLERYECMCDAALDAASRSTADVEF